MPGRSILTRLGAGKENFEGNVVGRGHAGSPGSGGTSPYPGLCPTVQTSPVS
jgi:hypothetical protein